MSNTQLRKARSNTKTHEQKVRLTPAQYQRLSSLLDTYSQVMGRKVSQSVLFARASDLLADHLRTQLEAKPLLTVREEEKAAVLSCLW